MVYLKRADRYIFNLVTKERYFQKPTYESLQSSLNNLRKLCEKLDVRVLAMPKIGCMCRRR